MFLSVAYKIHNHVLCNNLFSSFYLIPYRQHTHILIKLIKLKIKTTDIFHGFFLSKTTLLELLKFV